MRTRGFTLIELLVTLAILGLLATAAAPMAELTARRVRETELRHALREIRTAIDAYKQAGEEGRIARAADATGYPASLRQLVDGVPQENDAAKRRIYFLRRVPPDPFYVGPAVSRPEDTWGLRAYSSPPDRPQSGKDVFDVYSTSQAIGLNGTPYSQW
ncbi:type II secretion system protein [Variovorax sp.]|uniref:type II secretion system protein n=1 Tax=Variovorax sp. TaxID=1871043 RepID=UPI002D4456FD|nr:type II secretion system protein [Variovorax sp.]HYP85382.1 type II secretion system protein [Variovorax sp.]